MHEDINLRRQQRDKIRREHQLRAKKLKLTLIAAAAALLLCGAIIAVLVAGKPAPLPTDSTTLPTSATQPHTDATQAAQQEQEAQTSVVHLAFAGDLCVTDRTVAAGGENMDYTNVFMDVLPLLTEADLTVLNFEGLLCGAPYGSATSSAPVELAHALKKAGVDMVQVANSATVRGGLKGLGTTLDNFQAAGLDTLGAYRSREEAQQSGGFVLREVGGVRIAFVAFTKGMDGLGLPADGEGCVNLLYEDYTTTYQDVDKAGINRILNAVQEQVPDLVVAMVHWGSEYNSNISDSQESVLKVLRNGGVDVVIGTHSHVLQVMKLDSEKNTFTAYSMGDFLSDGDHNGTRYSVVLDLEITKDNATGETSVTGYTGTPIYNQITEDGMRLLRTEPAIAAYESGNLDRVSQADYEAMVSSLTRIYGRIYPEE